MRWLYVCATLVATTSAARADAPSDKLAVATARTWVKALASDSDGADALAITAVPFLFDHDAKPCAAVKGRLPKAVLACLIADTQSEVGDWTPSRVRVETTADFITWQANPKRDIIDQHRKQLARLADHAFVHFDSTAPGGTYEIVIAVKAGDDGQGMVDAFLANFLPTAVMPDEAAARTAATKWTAEVVGDSDTQHAAISRSTVPFFAYGMPHAELKGCSGELRATDAKQLATVVACIAAGDRADALSHLPAAKWDIVTDPAAIKTTRNGDDDHFLARLGMLDRLSYDHVLLFNKWHDDDTHVEIVVAARIDPANKDHVVIDAAVANLY